MARSPLTAGTPVDAKIAAVTVRDAAINISHDKLRELAQGALGSKAGDTAVAHGDRIVVTLPAIGTIKCAMSGDEFAALVEHARQILAE
jgi:hypothetical protein